MADSRAHTLRQAYETPMPENGKAEMLRAAYGDKNPVTEFGKQFVASAVAEPGAAVESVVERMMPIGQFKAMASLLGIEGAQKMPSEIDMVRKYLGVEGMAPEKYLEETGDPDTLAGRVGRYGGMAATFAVGGGGVASGIPRVGANVGKIRGFLQNLLADAGQTFKNAPLRTTGLETTAGMTAGAAGFLVEQQYPDSDAARFVGEVLGGLTPFAAIGAGKATLKMTAATVKMLPMSRMLINAGKSMTLRGGEKRAIDRFGRAFGDEVDINDALARMDEDVLEGMTPAQKAGNRGGLSLERDVIESSDALKMQSDDQISGMNERVRMSMGEIGTVSPETTRSAFESLQTHLTGLLDTRVRIAAQQTNERVAALGPKAGREQVNKVASEEIQKALIAARTQEGELYDAIPLDAVVPTMNSRNALRMEILDTSKAQAGDISPTARRLLDIDSKGYLGDMTDIKQLRGLQSKLREEARIARSNKQYNKARISDDVANAITEDLKLTQGGPEVVNALKTAVGFSRELNDKFSRGTIGTLLGYSKQGGRTIDETLSLEKTLGMGGPAARTNYDAILKATGTPEVRGAAEDYVTHQFLSKTSRNGEFNSDLAKSWLANNEEMLMRMPSLRQKINAAVESKDLQVLRTGQRERFINPKTSKAALFIEKGPLKAMDAIVGSRNSTLAATEMQKLINLASRDKSGEAGEGLKSGFMEWLMKKSETRALDMTETPYVSGAMMRKLLNSDNGKAMAGKLLSAEERKRLDTIVSTAEKMDMTRNAGESKEGILGDLPGKTMSVLVRVIGARFGSHVAKQTGTGGIQVQSIFAHRFKEMLNNGVIDPGRRLIIDAVQNEELFKRALQGEMTPQRTVNKQSSRYLNAWAAVVMAEQGGRMSDEEPVAEQQQPPADVQEFELSR